MQITGRLVEFWLGVGVVYGHHRLGTRRAEYVSRPLEIVDGTEWATGAVKPPLHELIIVRPHHEASDRGRKLRAELFTGSPRGDQTAHQPDRADVLMTERGKDPEILKRQGGLFTPPTKSAPGPPWQLITTLRSSASSALSTTYAIQ